MRIRYIALLLFLPIVVRAQPDTTADVPVRRVVLFTSGVGYFEHEGSISGDTDVVLRFSERTLNDVLKSLVIEDHGGRIAGVTYPSEAPIGRTLGAFAVNLTNATSLSDVLGQLRGAEVEVDSPDGHVRGTVLGVSNQQFAVGQTVVTAPVLTVMSRDGLRNVRLDTARGVQLVDPLLRQELMRALEALANARSTDQKPMHLQFRGGGHRTVRFGYVIESPVWKTSYRLILPDEDEGEGTLQGWALVENPTESDWTNVELSLVSGQPISFVQDLYTPLYISRPVVQVRTNGLVAPQRYEEGVGQPSDDISRADERLPILRDAVGVARLQSGQEQLIGAISARYGDAQSGVIEITTITPTGTSGDIGEFFQYSLGEVTLPRHGSAMLPIVADAVRVERLSIYNESVMERNAMRGVRLTNTTDKYLLGGPMTVFDEGYAGDALLDDLKPGRDRLLSFAIDQDLIIDASPQSSGPSRVVTGRIVDGILRLQRRTIYERSYRITNRGDSPRTILIEHNRRAGTELIDTPEPVEQVGQLDRYRIELAPNGRDTLRVRESITAGERIVLQNQNLSTLTLYAASNSGLPATVRQAIQQAVRLRQDWAETEREIATLETELAEITQDQERIRGNMTAVQAGTAYYRRLLRKLDEQETRIDRNGAEIERLRELASRQERAFRNYLRNLDIG